jgi:hypothetical protein
MVTTDVYVWKVAPGAHPEAPQTMICWSAVVPAGTPHTNVSFRKSRPDTAQLSLTRSPNIMLRLGNACIRVPQLQLPRANRPPQRTAVILVPSGAWKVWAEKVRPLPVAVVIRSLIPALSASLLGQIAYELPARVVVETQASLAEGLPAPASHDTTVYRRASAAPPEASVADANAQAIAAL